VLSWVFRNRERLMIVYGRVAPPPLVGRRFAASSAPAGSPGRDRRPGRIVRRRRWTVLVPMRRPDRARGARGTHVDEKRPFGFTPDS